MHSLIILAPKNSTLQLKLYGQRFLQRFFQKNLCENLCSVRGPFVMNTGKHWKMLLRGVRDLAINYK